MAIVIPSKNIFEKKNDKVIKNALKKIDFSFNDIQCVFSNDNLSDKIYYSIGSQSASIPKETVYDDNTAGNRYILGCETIVYPLSKKITLPIKPLANDSNYYITSVNPTLETQYKVSIEKCSYSSYYGQVQSGEPRIRFNRENAGNKDYEASHLYQNDIYGEYNQPFLSSLSSLQVPSKAKLNIKVEESQIVASVTYLSEDGNNTLYEQSQTISSSLISGELGSTSNVYLPSNISYTLDDTNYYFDIKCLSKIEIYLGWDIVSLPQNALVSRPLSDGLKVTLELIDAKIVYGEQIAKIESVGTVTNSLELKNAIGNEIISIGNELITPNNQVGSKTGKAIYKGTLQLYQYGKETAEIECSISDYYDEYGNKVVSKDGITNKMTLDLYDIVLPYIRSANGQDAPMSTDYFGNPKLFEVLGSTLTYDGRTRQKLSLQEVTYKYSDALSYELSSTQDYYIVTGIGTCDDKNIAFPPIYNSLPVTTIKNAAFRENTTITGVTFPYGVTKIDNYAFYGCSRLTSVKISDSVTSIGISAFGSCNNLKTVYITNVATWCNIDFKHDYSNPLYYAPELYLNNELITELVIPDGVTTIPKRAFHRQSSITSAVVPNTVTTIGYYAFNMCTNLIAIYYKGTEEDWSNISIDADAFYKSPALIYYYAETQPTESGNYWHYVNGIPTIW